MSATTGPSPKAWQALLSLRANLLVGASMIARKGNSPKEDEHLRQAAVLQAENDRVRGNRLRAGAATWDDAQLCLLATIQSALEVLGEEVS